LNAPFNLFLHSLPVMLINKQDLPKLRNG